MFATTHDVAHPVSVPAHESRATAGLNPQQLNAVNHVGSPLLIVAGAGTGKTKTLVSRVVRILDEGADPNRVLLLTFTRRAASEMLGRVAAASDDRSASQVWGGTFHSTANRLLRNFGPSAGLPEGFTVLDQSDSTDLMGLVRTEEGFGERSRRFPRKETIAGIYSRLVNGQAKLSDVLDTSYPWCADHGDALKAIFTAYTARKRRHHVLDYDDLLLFWRGITVGPTGDMLRNLFDHILIDEFQDTNPIQFALLWRLHHAGVPALVVGDVKQAIMGFQGADPRLFEQLPRQFPKDVDPLDTNWRSHKTLMAFLNTVGGGLFGEEYITLDSRADFESQLSALEVIEAGGKAVGKAKTALLGEGVARIRALLDDENARVWDSGLECHRRLRGSDIAVLGRTHSLLDKFAEALRGAGIRVRRQERDWVDSPVVQLACRALAYVADPADRHAALAVAVTELGSSDLEPALTSLLDGEPIEDPVLASLDGVVTGGADRSVPELLAEMCEALGLWDRIARWPDAASARADLLKLHADAAHFHEAPPEALASAGIHGAGAKSFLAWLPLYACDDRNNRPEPRVRDDDAVVLTTWHAAKGREWPVVLIAGLDDKVEPRLPDDMVWFDDFEDLDEILDRATLEISPKFDSKDVSDRFSERLRHREHENARRLLYVALTRARETVILQWPAYLRDGLSPKDDEKATYWSLLRDAAGLELGPTGLVAGNETFPCRIIHAEPGGDEPEAPEAVLPLPILGRRALVLRAAPAPVTLTPDQIAPSTLHGTGLALPGSLRTELYAQPFEANLPGSAIARGNLLHRAFEVLFGHPERRELLARATGVDLPKGDVDAICSAVIQFEKWLADFLNPVTVHTEVPFVALNDQGSTLHGEIDLLVETNDGVWIIDHKSDQTDGRAARFDVYWPQLEAYAVAVRSVGAQPVRGVAVNWISAGEAMLMDLE
jgi:ATP-dependent helicase/nuclease subunit A